MTGRVTAAPDDLDALAAEVERMAGRRYSVNTVRSYETGIAQFSAWCATNGRQALPADASTVALWIARLCRPREGEQKLSPNTIKSRLAAIPYWHLQESAPVPDLTIAHQVRMTYQRERSDEGWKERRVDPFMRSDLLIIRDAIDFSKPIGVRDWAILLLSIAMMGRRSELSCLDITDIGLDGEWMVIRVCSSKTDQAGNQEFVQVRRGQDHTLCPVAAVLDLMRWMAMKGIEDGALFRAMQSKGTKLTIHGEAKSAEALTGRLSPQGFSRALQRMATHAGLDLDVAGHSGRATGATLSHIEGASLVEIADQGRWVRGSKALYGYLRALDMRKNNPIARVF